MPQPSKARLHLQLIVAEPDCRLWLGVLITCLEEAGYSVGLKTEPQSVEKAFALQRMAWLEAKIYRLARNLWEAMPTSEPRRRQPASDIPIRIALSGSSVGADLAIWLDSEQGIGQLGASLLNGHVPLVEILDGTGKIRASGLPAIEEPGLFVRALDQFARRLATLILMALDRQQRESVSPEDMREPPAGQSAVGFLGSALTKKATGRLAGAFARKEHWRVGIRPAREPFRGVGDQHLDGFAWLPDDGERYYADPILWEEDGRDFLFVEEFPYTTGRGIIAYTELDERGQAKFAPRPVIERKTHLSYPLMFRHEGAIYMLPENAAENHLPLYRAISFPDQWRECAPLVAGTGLHDATLIEHEGAWWLIANEAREGGSSWDCMCLYHAPSPLGPFVPHPANPLLVDARLARSGGPVMMVEGKLIRPVQNCLGGYGRFLRFTEITMLSEEGFQQRETGRILLREGSRIAGVHSYGRNARFEVIDALTTRRWPGKPE
ncbi:MAG: glucosamine inositolphosphorylceramide transferase family protein [Rhabdaerophilum sp.]